MSEEATPAPVKRTRKAAPAAAPADPMEALKAAVEALEEAAQALAAADPATTAHDATVGDYRLRFQAGGLYSLTRL